MHGERQKAFPASTSQLLLQRSDFQHAPYPLCLGYFSMLSKQAPDHCLVLAPACSQGQWGHGSWWWTVSSCCCNTVLHQEELGRSMNPAALLSKLCIALTSSLPAIQRNFKIKKTKCSPLSLFLVHKLVKMLLICAGLKSFLLHHHLPYLCSAWSQDSWCSAITEFVTSSALEKPSGQDIQQSSRWDEAPSLLLKKHDSLGTLLPEVHSSGSGFILHRVLAFSGFFYPYIGRKVYTLLCGFVNPVLKHSIVGIMLFYQDCLILFLMSIKLSIIFFSQKVHMLYKMNHRL